MHGSSNVAPHQSGRDNFVTLGQPAILYQADSVVVTTAHFEWAGYRYPVVELGDVERVKTGGLLQARQFELWAWFRGERVCVFKCPDEREFGQVCRALTRARERAGLT